MIVGTTTSTQTDDSGNYSLTVADNATLAFSYVGYVSQRMSVAGKSVVNAALVSEEATLEEVVVVAVANENIVANTTTDVLHLGERCLVRCIGGESCRRGRIAARGAVDRGASFRFWLPNRSARHSPGDTE